VPDHLEGNMAKVSCDRVTGIPDLGWNESKIGHDSLPAGFG